MFIDYLGAILRGYIMYKLETKRPASKNKLRDKVMTRILNIRFGFLMKEDLATSEDSLSLRLSRHIS